MRNQVVELESVNGSLPVKYSKEPKADITSAKPLEATGGNTEQCSPAPSKAAMTTSLGSTTLIVSVPYVSILRVCNRHISPRSSEGALRGHRLYVQPMQQVFNHASCPPATHQDLRN